MKASLTVTGIQEVIVGLRYIAQKIPANGRKQMHRIADQIVKEAKLNAPHDTGALEDSIHKVVTYEGTGRLSINIEMGGFVDGVDVDIYAVQVHENYSSMHPGKGTIQKRLANPGRYIGEKFLERAEMAVRPNVNSEILQAVTEKIDL